MSYALLIALTAAFGASDQIVVDPSKQLNRIDDHLYGQFLEHIYNSVVDGLWGELVRGPSFEEMPENLGEGYAPSGGGWMFEGNELLGSGTNARVFFGDPEWTDYTFSVEAYKSSGAEGFLILFRGHDKDNFYWWNLGGWGNRNSAVEHEVKGQRHILDATQSDTRIDAGKWYQVSVRVAGEEVTCSLDGQVLCRFEDKSNGHGQVGLGTWGTDVRYRNARVTANEQTLFSMKAPEKPSQISGPWKALPEEASGMTYRMDKTRPLNSEYSQYMKSEGAGGGLTQNKVALEMGITYTGSLWMRGHANTTVQLADESTALTVNTDTWQEFPYVFRPSASIEDAAFSIQIQGAGELWLDCCTLRRLDMPYRQNIFEAVKNLGPAFIRWPGGCYAEYYRWQDGIGPEAARQSKTNVVWGGIDPNFFGTDEYIQCCRDTGADPLIVINIGQHAPDAEVDAYLQEAVNWVEYCNGDVTTPYGALRAKYGHSEPYRVMLWEIGNETWHMGPEKYAERVKLFTEAMRKKDSRLKFLVCGSGDMNMDWNRRIIDLAATHMDFLSVHHYMQGTYEAEMKDAVGYPAFLHDTAKVIADSGNPEIKIAVTEWNEQSVALRGGVYAGVLLNEFERHGDDIAMACPALFIRKTDAQAWDNALINHDSNKLFTSPNALVMSLYRDNYASIRIAAEAPEPLNVIGSYDTLKEDIIIKVVNPSETEDVSAEVLILGYTIPEFKRWRVHSAHIDDKNSLEEPDTIESHKSTANGEMLFPAHSITVLRAEKPNL